MITIRFACGHLAAVASDATTVPVCACGERRIQYVQAPPPRFRGVGIGPHATPARAVKE